LDEIVVANEVVDDVKKLKKKVSLLCLKFIMRKSITLLSGNISKAYMLKMGFPSKCR